MTLQVQRATMAGVAQADAAAAATVAVDRPRPAGAATAAAEASVHAKSRDAEAEAELERTPLLLAPATAPATATTTAAAAASPTDLGAPSGPAPAARPAGAGCGARWEWALSTKGLLAIGMCTLVAFLVVDFATAQYVQQVLLAFMAWVESNIFFGAVAFTAVYAFCTIILVPESFLCIGCGYTFYHGTDSVWEAVAIASLVSWLGSSIGNIAAFYLGRFVLRDAALAWSRKHTIMRAIDKASQPPAHRPPRATRHPGVQTRPHPRVAVARRHPEHPRPLLLIGAG